MNSIRVRPEATRDVALAAGWYESRRTNLGIEFVLEVDTAVDRAAENPQHYAPVYDQVRRVLLPRSRRLQAEFDALQGFWSERARALGVLSEEDLDRHMRS